MSEGTTITLSDVVRRLSDKVKCGDDTAGAFLRDFSSAVLHGLASDGIVRVDYIGVFKVTSDVEGNRTVEFAPDVKLAESVNEPFSMFESVEVADTLSDEDLENDKVVSDESIESKAAKTPPPIPSRFSRNEEPTVEPEEVRVEDDVRVEDEMGLDSVSNVESDKEYAHEVESDVESENESTNSEVESEVKSEEQPKEDARPTVVVNPQVVVPPMPDPMSVRLEPESRVTIKRMGHSTLTLVVTAIAACLLGLVVGYITYRYVNFELPANVEILDEGILIRHEAKTADARVSRDDKAGGMAADSTALVATADKDNVSEDTARNENPSTAVNPPAVVTDTVRPGNYLSVMARRHYGSAKFWVYIYIENKDKIRDPDNLEDGMVLVIPPASKYDIDPADKESLKRADREAYKAIQQ